MKHISIIFIFVIALILSGTVSSCNKGPSCPAYNSVHNSKNYGYNPNNAARAEENNKQDIEKRRDAELKGKGNKRKKRSYSLFPKGMGIKSH